MCSYNAVNGIPLCVNTPALEQLLRKQWGFKGYVVSDCGAIDAVASPSMHGYVGGGEEALAAALKAGTDLMCDNWGRAEVRRGEGGEGLGGLGGEGEAAGEEGGGLGGEGV